MRLEWSQHAVQDRNDIFDFIEQHSPGAAVWIDSRIHQQLRALLRHPASGRLGRVRGTRELVITRTPYIAAYRLLPMRVRVLRILHSAQQWPDISQERSRH
ncbi:type II toxin-antitoxin system RelE/ParE family toxin [Pandoraea sp. PE-S2T-3]|uniref:type II toxin-antitoxin system RelE/ParE family toxin n=1 Tax=Pandoraea sp. PE-S2T-3 TaxID=1986993 RepID=UPI000B3FD55C|nr:type II toxin-antitoxin system RelE/ParE family toxin [Pandoraea sp. PE-S2T-3]